MEDANEAVVLGGEGEKAEEDDENDDEALNEVDEPGEF